MVLALGAPLPARPGTLRCLGSSSCARHVQGPGYQAPSGALRRSLPAGSPPSPGCSLGFRFLTASPALTLQLFLPSRQAIAS